MFVWNESGARALAGGQLLHCPFGPVLIAEKTGALRIWNELL
jgi:hypothetical protein